MKSTDDFCCFQDCLNSLHGWSLVWHYLSRVISVVLLILVGLLLFTTRGDNPSVQSFFVRLSTSQTLELQ